MTKFAQVLTGLLLAAAGVVAQAQTYPVKPIRLVEPAGAGSAVDVFARMYGPLMAEALGQPVIVDNRPGANSAIGAREVARSTPDGYTLLHGNINNALNDLLTADPCCRLTDALIPVARMTVTPLVMVVNPSVDAKDLAAYLALARARPTLLTFASGGPGSITQLLGEKFKTTAKVGVREIPYKAIGAELPDLLAGHVTTAFLSPVAVKDYVNSGRLRALGVASSRRLAIIPAVPTLAEAGLAGVEASGWNGLFAPAGTPKAVVARLAAESAKVLASPAMRNDAVVSGYELDPVGPDEFAAFVRAEIAKWGKVIKDAEIRIER